MRISDWSSDVCSSDLPLVLHAPRRSSCPARATGLPASSAGWVHHYQVEPFGPRGRVHVVGVRVHLRGIEQQQVGLRALADRAAIGKAEDRSRVRRRPAHRRSEEHTSELQSLMRISYAVFCLKKKKKLLVHKDQIPYTDLTTIS